MRLGDREVNAGPRRQNKTTSRSSGSFVSGAVQFGALATAVLVLAASASMKLFPNPSAPTGSYVLEPASFISRSFGALELILAAGLAWRATRVKSAQLTACIAAGGFAYMVFALWFGTPDCGCFGGWYRVGIWNHMALSSLLFGAVSVLHDTPKTLSR